jgi:predicted hydrocarbon binding protein
MQHGVIGIGSSALRTIRNVLGQELGEDVGATRLQEAGYAAGEEIYRGFCEWLSSRSGVSDPGDLDASRLSDVLSEYFGELGWGTISVERTGAKGLTVMSENWAEADPDGNLEGPSCYFSTGLLASFFTSLATGSPLAVMEMECRSQGDARCQFLAGSPDTLSAVYEAVLEEQDYREVLTG